MLGQNRKSQNLRVPGAQVGEMYQSLNEPLLEASTGTVQRFNDAKSGLGNHPKEFPAGVPKAYSFTEDQFDGF